MLPTVTKHARRRLRKYLKLSSRWVTDAEVDAKALRLIGMALSKQRRAFGPSGLFVLTRAFVAVIRNGVVVTALAKEHCVEMTQIIEEMSKA